MSRKKKPLPIIENVEIEACAAEGKSLFHWNDLVVFVPFCVPGDIADIQITRKKHSFAEGEVVRFIRYSNVRAIPRCQHFGICGGCKWQNLPYSEQLKMKQQQVYDQLTRIGHLELPNVSGSEECSSWSEERGARSENCKTAPTGKAVTNNEVLSEEGNLTPQTEFRPILGSVQLFEYRNKLDFGASNRRWLTKEEVASGREFERNALGFHITGAFDKILPIEQCHLMHPLHNEIRNEIRDYALANNISFFDLRQQTGLLRDVIIRNSNTGEWMVIVQFHYDDEESPTKAKELLQYIADKFPQISSLLYLDNQKCNDTIGDQEIRLFKGNDHIFEQMEDLRFKVGPKSFYQTNTEQAYHLYSVVRELMEAPLLSPQRGEAPNAPCSGASLLESSQGGETPNAPCSGASLLESSQGGETPNTPCSGASLLESSPLGGDKRGGLVYDLYTGTGTIANFVARQARQVIGIEYVPEAIEDAKVNSQVNGIDNTLFFAGDMKDILNDEFLQKHGRPDIIITDPPRAGMHPDVVQTILRAAPARIVYVSCNPATQARDLQELCHAYDLRVIQPVDMFPHTPHVENVVLLTRKSTIV